MYYLFIYLKYLTFVLLSLSCCFLFYPLIYSTLLHLHCQKKPPAELSAVKAYLVTNDSGIFEKERPDKSSANGILHAVGNWAQFCPPALFI